MNPLSFSKKQKRPQKILPSRWTSVSPGHIPEQPEPRERVKRLSKREELAQQAQKVGASVFFQVQGVDQLRNGEHQVPFTADQPLRIYLHLAGLIMAGVKYAMYDQGQLEKGRLRTSYIPPAGARILICNPELSPILLERQARKVRTVGLRVTATEATMDYSQRKPAPPKKEPTDGVDQW